jgi:hypothetical protein
MSEEKLSDREIAIRGRVAAGLSRQQAEEVQAQQVAHDAELEKASKPKGKKADEASGKKPDDDGGKKPDEGKK